MIPESTIKRLLDQSSVLAQNNYHELVILRGTLNYLAEGYSLDVSLQRVQDEISNKQFTNDKTKQRADKDCPPQTAGLFRQCKTWYKKLFC